MSATLFAPVTLGALELKNRIVMAPLTRSRADNPGFVPTELMARYYAQRASAGLIVSEAAIISPAARGYPYTPGIWSDEQVAGWRRVTDAVHAEGGLIVCQLWHCGRLSLPDYHNGQPPLAPSPLNPGISMFSPEGMKETVTPRAMTADDIVATVVDYGHATKNAMAAGFDGVEIHSSNGYLIHQFLSSSSNGRNDDYGGSVENRARFFFEVLDAVLDNAPADRVGFRLNPMMHRAHGLLVTADTLPVFEHVVRGVARLGLAYMHLTELMTPDQLDGAENTISDIAAHFRPLAPELAIVSNGGFNGETAAAAVASGRSDAVAFGRAFISNPDLVARLQQGVPLAKADSSTFYQGGERGYIDYPTAT